MQRRKRAYSILTSVFVILQIFLIPAISLCQNQKDVVRKVDANDRIAIIETVIQQLNKYYHNPDVAKGMEELLRKNLKENNYDQLSDQSSFLSRLTEDLRFVSNDLHLGIWPIEMALIAEDPSSEEQKELDERARHQNYGIQTVAILPGNIGYLEMTEFMGGKQAEAAAVAAMNFLAGSDAIIFDMRRNGGGEGTQLRLIIGDLIDEKIRAMSVYSRIDDTTRESWIEPNGQGSSLLDIPVYVLQSNRTASAAESFSSILKSSKRGKIVGETSRGAANPVEEFNFPELSFCMAVSAYRVFDPVSGVSWEGRGIEPDISVPTEKALYAACIDAIKQISKNSVTEDIDMYRQWALEKYKAELDPVTLSVAQLTEYVGEYEKSREIKRVQGRLVLFESIRAPITLIPLGNDSFAFVEEKGKLEFMRNKAGEEFGIKIQYADGFTVFCRRK